MKWGSCKVLQKAFICIIPPLQPMLLLHKGRTCLGPYVHIVQLFELERQEKLDSHDSSWNLKWYSQSWFLVMCLTVSWQSDWTSQKLTENLVKQIVRVRVYKHFGELSYIFLDLLPWAFFLSNRITESFLLVTPLRSLSPTLSARLWQCHIQSFLKRVFEVSTESSQWIAVFLPCCVPTTYVYKSMLI